MKTIIKTIFLSLLSIVTMHSSGQLPKKTSLLISGNFNFGINKFRTSDDAGFGLHTTGLFFARNKAGVTAEAGIDIFLGDKSLYVGGNEGLINSNPVVQSLRVGPHIFVTPAFLTSATFGIARSCIREYEFSTHG